MVLAALTFAPSTSDFAGTFCGDLGRGPVISGKMTIPLELMVLMLEVREFQIPRVVFQKVRTKFINGP